MSKYPGTLPLGSVRAEKQVHVGVIDILRGVASLAVVLFHLIGLDPAIPASSMVSRAAQYGRHGVTVFFVISGFVLPYALHNGGYTLKSFRPFIVKRLVRLEPPYLASILLCLALGVVATLVPGFRGKPFVVDPLGLILHIGYLNQYFGYESLNIVYWTLAIELQFYVVIGLSYRYVVSTTTSALYPVATALLFIALSTSKLLFLPYWLPVFMMGIAAFRYRVKIAHVPEFLGQTLVLSAACAWHMGVAYGIAAALTAVLIAFVDATARGPWAFLGRVSYSLYLVHAPIGLAARHLAARVFSHTDGGLIADVVAVCVTVIAAALFHACFERPAQRWASKIRYRRRVAAHQIVHEMG